MEEQERQQKEQQEKVNVEINNGYSLKSLATDQKDLKIISVIINSLEEEQKKHRSDRRKKAVEYINRDKQRIITYLS